MEAAAIPEASARVILALKAAGRSRTTIKRHEAEFNAPQGSSRRGARHCPPRRTVSISWPSGQGPGSLACASQRVPDLPNSRVGP